VTRESVRRWADKLATDGSAKVLKKPGNAGRKARLGATELAIEAVLKVGAGKVRISDHPVYARPDR
jgi:hypothetical protein